MNTAQRDKQLQMVWLETVHARTWEGRVVGGPDRQECWPGIGRSRLRHLLSGGLCTVKPRCSFPQLRPRLNCCTWDQSPGGHRRLEERAAATPRPIYQEDVSFFFFLHTFKRCEDKCFSCAPWPLSKLFSFSVGICEANRAQAGLLPRYRH